MRPCQKRNITSIHHVPRLLANKIQPFHIPSGLALKLFWSIFFWLGEQPAAMQRDNAAGLIAPWWLSLPGMAGTSLITAWATLVTMAISSSWVTRSQLSDVTWSAFFSPAVMFLLPICVFCLFDHPLAADWTTTATTELSKNHCEDSCCSPLL